MVFCKRQVGLCMCVIITSIRPDMLVNFCMTSKHEHTRLSLMSKHACSKAQKQCCAECCPSADGNISDTHTQDSSCIPVSKEELLFDSVCCALTAFAATSWSSYAGKRNVAKFLCLRIPLSALHWKRFLTPLKSP